MKTTLYVGGVIWGTSFVLRSLLGQEWHDQYIISIMFFIGAIILEKIEELR